MKKVHSYRNRVMYMVNISETVLQNGTTIPVSVLSEFSVCLREFNVSKGFQSSGVFSNVY